MLRKPEDLTNAKINQIGRHYFYSHMPVESSKLFDCIYFLKHSNHTLSLQLCHYAENTSTFHKWLFLADFFSRMPRKNGELASILIKQFQSAFGQSLYPYNLIFEEGQRSDHSTYLALRSIVCNHFIQFIPIQDPAQNNLSNTLGLDNPDQLSDSMIQAIGTQYLAKRKNREGYFGFLDNWKHQHQRVAIQLSQYNGANTPYGKWHFLADTYANLNASKGEIAGDIMQLFTTAFGTSVKTQIPYLKILGTYQPAEVAIALKGIVNQYYADLYSPYRPALK